MTTRASARAQIHMEETLLNDPELEEILDERQELKEQVSLFRKKDKEAKDKIAKITKPFPVRIGRYVISRQETPGRSVSFETGASNRIVIKHVDEA